MALYARQTAVGVYSLFRSPSETHSLTEKRILGRMGVSKRTVRVDQTQSRCRPSKSKAIFTLKPARKPELTIKATFEDKNGDEVKELIYRYDEGDPKEHLILMQSQLLQLSKQYNLWEGDK